MKTYYILLFVGVVIYSAICIIIAEVAGKKKVNYWTSFFVSFFASPVCGLLYIIASTVREKED